MYMKVLEECLGPSIFSPSPGGTISVEMNNGDENEMLIPKNVVIATGSRPRTLPGLKLMEHYVMSSDEALSNERTTKINYNCWWWCNWD